MPPDFAGLVPQVFLAQHFQYAFDTVEGWRRLHLGADGAVDFCGGDVAAGLYGVDDDGY
ncbi:hypothetical protein ACIBCN_19030 [Nocardia sp. NPDC051052]|uniref:hypothetical protein n=1 Tax=Nocardia sp. NPDC051052 TaxID=3364322 RepID=UPI0037A064BD